MRGVASAFSDALGSFVGPEMTRALDGQSVPEDPTWAAVLGNSVRAAETVAAMDALLLPDGVAPPQCSRYSVARPLEACLEIDASGRRDVTSCCYALNRAFAPGPSPKSKCLCHEAVLVALNGALAAQAAPGSAAKVSTTPLNDLMDQCSREMSWFSASYFRQPGGGCGVLSGGMADFGQELPRSPLVPILPVAVQETESPARAEDPHKELVGRLCKGVKDGPQKRLRCHRIEGCVCEVRKGRCGSCLAEQTAAGIPAAEEAPRVFAAAAELPAAGTANELPLPAGGSGADSQEEGAGFWETVGLAKEIFQVTGQAANPFLPLVSSSLPQGAKDRLGSLANSVLGKSHNSSDAHANSTLNQIAGAAAGSIGRLANNEVVRSAIISRLPEARQQPVLPQRRDPQPGDISMDSIGDQLAESHNTWVEQVGTGARVLDGPSQMRISDHYCGPMPEEAQTAERHYKQGEYAKVFVVEKATPNAEVALLASTSGGNHRARFDVGPQSHCIGVKLGLAPARSKKTGSPVLFRKNKATGAGKAANFFRKIVTADSEGTAVFEIGPTNHLWSPYTDAHICQNFWFQAVDLSACEAGPPLDLSGQQNR